MLSIHDHLKQGSILLSILVVSLLKPVASVNAQGICYLQNTNGQEIDLSALCGTSERIKIVKLDQKFLDILARITNEESLDLIGSEEKRTLPYLGQQVCAQLEGGKQLTAIKPSGNETKISPRLFLSVKTAAIVSYCPQYANAIRVRTDN